MKTSTPRKSDKYIPLYFVAFFVVVAIVNGFFVYFAISTNTGVVTENAYEKGLHYNTALKQAENAKNVVQNLSFKQTSKDNALVKYSIETKENISSVVVQIIRPLEGDYNLEVQLKRKKDFYSANISFPKKGVWDLLAIAKTDNAEFRKKQRIFIEQKEDLPAL